MYELVITSAFGSYAVGDVVTNPAVVDALKAGPNRAHFVQRYAEETPAAPEPVTIRLPAPEAPFIPDSDPV